MKKKIKKQKHTRSKQFTGVSSITDTKDFSAKIIDKNGNKELKISSPVWYQHQLNKFKVGERVSIYISTRKPKRSEQQNRYYWGAYLPIISKETGEKNLDRLHKLFTGMFLTESIELVLGKQVRMTKSTATLSISEFSAYIESIEAETGVMAPPTINYFAPLKEEHFDK